MRFEGAAGGPVAYGDTRVAEWATADEEATAIRTEAHRDAPDAGAAGAALTSAVQTTVDASEGRAC